MPDLGPIYDATRRSLSDYVRALPETDLARSLPAAPNWTVRDVISHLSGDVASVLAGDFPDQFFASSTELSTTRGIGMAPPSGSQPPVTSR